MSKSDTMFSNLPGASASLAIAQQAALIPTKPLLLITSDSLSAARLVDELSFFCANPERIITFPDWETLPYDHFSPHQDLISDRLTVLHQLLIGQPSIIVTPIITLMHRLPPTDFLDQQSFVLHKGERIDLDKLRTRLTKAGYQHVTQVREHGEFAVRGSIIDLFPMGCNDPFRIDLLDDEVDSIRTFSPETQRTIEVIDRINLLPAKEFPLTDDAIEFFRQQWRDEFTGNPLRCPTYQDISEGICAPGIEYYLPLFFQQTATLFDYLPSDTQIIKLGDIRTSAEAFKKEVNDRYEQLRHDISRPLLPPEKLFLSPDDVLRACKNYQAPVNELKAEAITRFESIKAVEPFVKAFAGTVLFCAESTGRREMLLQALGTVGVHPRVLGGWDEVKALDPAPEAARDDSVSTAKANRVYMIVAPIEEGFVLNSPALAVITENELYGKRVMQRRLRKKSATIDNDIAVRDLTELQIGDPVVHIDHGVGRYAGLQTLTVGGQLAEFLTLEYQGNDKLYVPVSNLHLIGRYTGANAESTPISKLGTDQWQRTRRKAAEKIRDVAAELLDLYARRAARSGHTYQIPQDQYQTFTAAFPFEETPDQLQAIEQVFHDMTSDKPMDRVICGDVGFGKTEVALRAAFIAANNGKQVALLVPTTLLAQQHGQNFKDRLADWPIQVEILSRFRTGKEQQQVLQRLKEGKVDIVVGTHKLLQSDIEFKSLGLVIVDEEHRFGVKQKEKLKALRSSVDILTLTATPIPRTLNMSLAGIRDLSIIATPPAKRLSVKTFVHEYQSSLIQEAIQREIMRGGQVYFLHNDVSTIEKMARDIGELVPEARATVAHGQMHERDLERTMSEFYHRHFNVLVCSTIIESGIDIPTANTIIINRADKFGLAQLHQLRGRVGRSHHQAYAYLLAPPRNALSADANKRLEAIAKLDDLGIGFTLATHDLEIRGAGELLGEEQSGDMQELGFALYMELLSRAVDALKKGEEPDLEQTLMHHGAEADIRISALIPETYLGDVQLRLQFYKRIANANSVAELDDIQVEMIDRFGLLPDAAKNIFAISELKLKASELGITKIEAGEQGGKFEFNQKPNIKPETIIKLIQTEPKKFRLEGPTKLRFTLEAHAVTARVSLVDALVERLKS